MYSNEQNPISTTELEEVLIDIGLFDNEAQTYEEHKSRVTLINQYIKQLEGTPFEIKEGKRYKEKGSGKGRGINTYYIPLDYDLEDYLT